jgi:hypothetical protein
MMEKATKNKLAVRCIFSRIKDMLMPESIDVAKRNNGFARMAEDQGQKASVVGCGALRALTRPSPIDNEFVFDGFKVEGLGRRTPRS